MPAPTPGRPPRRLRAAPHDRWPDVAPITPVTPVTQVTQVTQAAAATPVARATPPAMEAATILVVDDNEMNRDLLSRRLRREGHTVRVAENGLEAMEMVASSPFDLVMLDIMMPEMNGYEVLERMKASATLRHIPVIMITAIGDAESVIRCIELGAEDHLPKPFNPLLLRARVGASLARKQLHDRQQLYARGLERELEIGREIQAGFLPGELPAPAGWELAARFAPARQVAGDFYDAFVLADGRVALVLADVCGKGVGAALFMALCRTLVRAVAEQRVKAAPPAGVDGLAATIAAVSDYIARTHGSASMFATLFIGALEPATGVVEYVNAGHEPPVVVGAGGARLRLQPTGPAVGLMEGTSFRSDRVTLARHETLVAFTDGATDARDADGRTFTEERLLALIGEPATSAEALLDRVLSAVSAHGAGGEQFDDVTLLALRHSPIP